MGYVTSVERRGRLEGLAEGLIKGERALLRRLPVRRFGLLPKPI